MRGYGTEEYAAAMDDFLIRMECLKEFSHQEVRDNARHLCQVLRIARLEADIFFDEENERQDTGTKIVLDFDEVPDEQNFIKEREVTGNGNIISYRISRIQGQEEWTEEEHRHIQAFVRSLFTFFGRANLSKIAANLSYRDQELGVYNLNYYMKMLNQLLAQGIEDGEYTAGYFNLARFSVVNRNVGRRLGTLVMGLYVGELQELIGKRGYVCRIGGDNFAILFPSEKLADVQKFLKGTDIVYDVVSNDTVHVSAYCGYYEVTNECQSGADVMDRISVAVHMARSLKNADGVFYNVELMQMQEQSKLIETMLDSALKEDKIQIFYQPKVLLNGYTLAGAEALSRWFHQGQVMPPNSFVPILEQSQAVCRLDFYVLEHVCRDIRKWMEEGRQVVKVSVNLSRRHLGNRRLLEQILEIIDRYEVPHKYIEIELTETTTDVDFTDLKKIVTGLHEAGISTAVDDFGMGYSSMNLLRTLPWDVLKIDKNFLPADGKAEKKDYIMLKYLIAMSQDMGLECIVEGVETVEQIKILKENNCFLAQGYYFDKPLPKKEFESRMK